MTTWKMVDTATHPTPEIAKGMKAEGVDVLAMYLGTGPKSIARKHVEVAHAAGLGVLLLWESLPTNKSFFTATRGLAEARAALSAANALGAPGSVIIVGSVDYAAAEADLPAIADYTDGWESVLQRRAGMYGDYRVCAYFKQTRPHLWLHQTYGWSYGQQVDGVMAYQCVNEVSLAGITVDMDVLYTRNGIWWPDAPKPAPVPQHQGGEDVPVPLLKQGVTGHDAAVKAVQGAVDAKPDGAFGPKTTAAVQKFQRDHGLKPDGEVGPKTWAVILK